MKKIICLTILMAFIFACKDTTDDGNFGNNNGAQDEPVGVLLVFPHQDSLCNEGENPTSTESTVYFEWVPNDNAQSYLLTIENLDTGNINQYETEDFIFSVTIERAMAYRWSVSYQLNGETKESALWNFYNAGPGVQTYAPFPADLIAPSMAQNITTASSVTLEWSGSDVDEDIVDYDVYFGVGNPPDVLATGVTNTEFAVSVELENIYYWYIVTKDAAGNSSQSETRQFRVID